MVVSTIPPGVRHISLWFFLFAKEKELNREPLLKITLKKRLDDTRERVCAPTLLAFLRDSHLCRFRFLIGDRAVSLVTTTLQLSIKSETISFIYIEIAFVFAEIANVVALREQTPDFRSETGPRPKVCGSN